MLLHYCVILKIFFEQFSTLERDRERDWGSISLGDKHITTFVSFDSDP